MREVAELVHDKLGRDFGHWKYRFTRCVAGMPELEINNAVDAHKCSSDGVQHE